MLSGLGRLLNKFGVLLQIVIGLLGLVMPMATAPVIYEGDTYIMVDAIPVDVVGDPGVATGYRGWDGQRPEVLKLGSDESGTAPPIEGHLFDREHSWGYVFVLTGDHYWIRGQRGGDPGIPQVERQGRAVSEQRLLGYFQSPGLQNQMKWATDIVAVGLASCEGDRFNELRRAGDRADQLIHWLGQAFPATFVNLWKINLGKHRENCSGATPEQTRRQRPVLFIALVRKEGIQIVDNQMIVEAMNTLPASVIRVEDYLSRGPLLEAN